MRDASSLVGRFILPEGFPIKEALLMMTRSHRHFALLDSCGNTAYGSSSFEIMCALGSGKAVISEAGNAFEKMKAFRSLHKDWMFGYFSYNLKNEVEQLTTGKKTDIAFPDMLFFIPKVLIEWNGSQLTIQTDGVSPESVFNELLSQNWYGDANTSEVALEPGETRAAYLQQVETIRKHIIDGDIYELNYCQSFSASLPRLDTAWLYREVSRQAKAPFSVYFGWEDKYLICASPERFLRIENSRVTSFPVKGTIRRGATQEEDNSLKEQLRSSEKDRAENVMIVDLVRNDLTLFARTGSVRVDELFGIYTFEQVHQMVSVISAMIPEGVDPVDVIKRAFPMGSMTGAPKVRAMELIDTLETISRGLYSGAFGYFTPEGVVDLNVIIRSFLYDSQTEKLSVSAGGAIVYDSDPNQEYDECLLKISGLIRALGAHAAIIRK